MPIQAGQTLLHYRLIEKIGEGGMGVVWKATDTTLDREVAIKVLPDAISQDKDRLARFEREAKLLASLNHANIATVHSVHETDGVRFLAMEFVEGEDLAQRVARGAIPVEEALRIAVQIAEALEAAHEAGIIHRDLKPANVKVKPDGRVKVLDFGLAKAFQSEATDPDPSASPTLTAATQMGVILGTAAYMSPEQARGEPVDKRADVWAFGCVLFEMLTGRRTFKENTVSDTLASVLKIEPEWSLLPEDLPHNVRRLLIRCIRKDAQQRQHDIADVRIELEETLATPPGSRSVAPATSARSRVPIGMMIVVAVAAVTVGLLAGLQFVPSSPEQRVRRFFVPFNAEGPQALSSPVLSPDGRRIVYDFDDRLWIHDLEQGISRPLDGAEGGGMPFWSPDSAHVGYRKDGSYWRIPVSGGQPALISEESSEWYPASWGDNGTIVFSTIDDIREVPARGGEPKTILQKNLETEQHFHEVYQLPGGRGLLLVLHREEFVDTIALWSGGERRNLLTFEEGYFGTPTYSPTGHILFTRHLDDGGLWALPFSLATLEKTGEPFLVVAKGTDGSTSSDGTLVYMDSGARRDVELVWFDASGKILGTIGQPQTDMEFPAISPDGTRVAVSGKEGEDWEIWVHDDTGSKVPITFDKGREHDPRWSRDGSRIFYHHPEGGHESSVYSVDADAGGDRELLTEGHQVSPARNDSRIVFVRESDETDGDLWWLSLDGDGDAAAFLQTEVNEGGPALSPDGRFLAYLEGAETTNVYVRPFPEGSEKWQVSVDDGWRAAWSPVGDRLYYLYYHILMEVQVSTDPVLRLGTPRRLIDPHRTTLQFWRGVDIAKDGKRFVGIREVERDDEEKVEEGIHVVLNWFSDFAD